MYSGKLVMTQLFDHLPMHIFRRCIAKYPSKYPVLKFSHFEQFACMAFAQLTHRESLHDIEICLRAHKLYHLGIRGRISRRRGIPLAPQEAKKSDDSRNDDSGRDISATLRSGPKSPRFTVTAVLPSASTGRRD